MHRIKLPNSKQAAIDQLGFGLIDKLYLSFNDVFWDVGKMWIVTPQNDLLPGQFNQWLDLYSCLGEPIVLAFNGAQPAKDLSVLDDEDIVARGLKILQLTYPNANVP